MPKTSALDLICTAADAAKVLGVTEERVLQFCRDERIQARKMGREWVLLTASVAAFSKAKRPPGRPPGK